MQPVPPNEYVLWLTLAAMCLPFASFLCIFFITRAQTALSLAISVACASVSLIAAWYLLLGLPADHPPIQFQVLWMAGAETRISFGFLLDPLSRLMLCIVTSISFLVQVYSLGYMAGDDGLAKYYSFLSLFAWSMISLVVAPGLLQLYVFWELVGLSSYLLIGFWHHKFSASEAGKKAFVMTRLGDLGFFIGIIVLLINLGDLNIWELNGHAAAKLSTGLLTASAVLIFCGVVGKSAQFPLLTWLPDAMEGPTPVSALLHSATMVAAGVYLVSRLFPFYAASPQALAVILAIGTITMLLSSTMAMVARDIKQVWAYSTVSQLGFMLMGLGAGSYFAGVFHLTTHAAFKALLFLCSGVFIHHFGSNDMYDIARGGGRRLKIPMITMTIAGSALAGVFPVAGFFSKEAVMGALANLPNPLWVAAGLLGAAMTAYYTFRLLFIIWFPPAIQEPDHDEAHGHGGHAALGYWAMAAPLVVLAGFTLALGLWGEEILHFIHWGHPPDIFHHLWLVPASMAVVFGGIGLAWLEFGRKRTAQAGFLARLPSVEALFAHRWYIDAFYRRMVDYMVYGVFSRLFTLNDRRVVDGSIDGVCRGTVLSGWLLSFVQRPLLQYNLFTMVLIIALVGLYFLVMH
jgi:NADH-quinone oxidoreductase subunit L